MDGFLILILVVVPGATLLAMLGLVLARRVLPQSVLESHNHIVGYIYAVLSVLTGVVVAFTVVAAWERHAEAEEIVEREANAVADLFRNAMAFPEPARSQLQDRLRQYAVTVEAEEWVSMARGEESGPAWQAHASVWREYLAFVPGTERESLWLERSIERLNDMGDARRLRLLRSRSSLPSPLWITLYALCLATIVFSYLFGVGTFRLHLIITGVVAAALALTLTLLWALQQPFGHIAPVSPDAFRELVAVFEHGWNR